jgi:hypothetical protein
MNRVIIDKSKCLSIKSKKEQSVQCTHDRKTESIFCGVHLRSKNPIRIDLLVEEFMKTYHYSYSELNQIDESLLSTQKLINTAKKYNINIGEYSDHQKSEIYSCVKKHINSIYEDEFVLSCGPASYNNTYMCQNDTDFFQLDSLDEIPKHFFFSFSDKENSGNKSEKQKRLYWCDFRSFHKYIKTQNDNERHINPYNRQPLSEDTMDLYEKKINFLSKYHPEASFDYPQPELSAYQKLKFRILDVFQTMYLYDYPVDQEWFLMLQRYDLLCYYRIMENIWNFRLGLSVSDKNKVAPGKPDIFNYREYNKLIKLPMLDIVERLIDIMEYIVTKGENESDRKNGVMYLLIGLVEISPAAARGLPYLVF